MDWTIHTRRRAATVAGEGATRAEARHVATGTHDNLVVTRNAAGACADSVHTILNTALIAEKLTATFYYKALTTPAVLHNPSLGGPSADPNNPGLPPGGNPAQVRYLQAALDAEVKHADLLSRAGATARITQFYFPPTAFVGLGSTLDRASFLGLLETLEALCLSIYIAAAGQFLRFGRPDLAILAAEITGVEAEHRTLGRVIGAVHPPNNLTLERVFLTCVSDAMLDLQPFLSGKQYLFAADATQATPVPTPAQTRRVIGKYGTRRLRTFF